PALSDALVSASASAVALPPAPATTGTRPRAALTVAAITATCSSTSSVADSPVVPTDTIPSMPLSICQSTSLVSASKSTAPLRNGVTSAVRQPSMIMDPLCGNVLAG